MSQATEASTLLEGALGGLTVEDAMHAGVISCPPATTLRAAARMLSTYRVHAVMVVPRHHADAGHVASWELVSDVDLMQAATERDLDRATVGEIAGGPVRCVQPDQPLATAVLTMLTNGVAHVVVVDRRSGRPVGILSALDVARALAGDAWPDEEC
jgi:CBS-domain-containing membrane protein